MTPLSLLTRDEALTEFVRTSAGAPDSSETLSDLVRAEVHARGHAPRAATLSRVARQLAPVLVVDDQRLNDVCDALEREGDIVLAPHGVVYATPTRVVDLGGRLRVFSSVPTRTLGNTLGGRISSAGATRTIELTQNTLDAVSGIGGVLLEPEVWAGIDRTPAADAEFIARLDQRLHWEKLQAGSLQQGEAFEWRTWLVTEQGMRWRSGNVGRLWWARTRFGGHLHAWTAGGSPGEDPFVVLSFDEADRARFALARDSSARMIGRRIASGDAIRLVLPFRLPRAEYRYLSLQASRSESPSGGYEWMVAPSNYDAICELFHQRLGIDWDDAPDTSGGKNDGNSAGGSEASLADSEARESANTGSRPKAAALESLDEWVPINGIQRLLSHLKVQTYRDLLSVDLTTASRFPGVGPGRFAILLTLINEAKRRAGEAEVARSHLDAPRQELPIGRYDDWIVLDAFGYVPQRFRNAIAAIGVRTIGELRSFMAVDGPQRIQGVGASTLAEIRELLARLELEGHESLIFGGPPPADLAEFGLRYIKQLHSNVRELVALRWVHGWTLQRIADRRGVSRERVRQLLQRESESVPAGWRNSARSLLAPMVNAIDARGGIASVGSLWHASNEVWPIELAAEVGGVDLRFNVPIGIATTLENDTFEEVRDALRDACDDQPNAIMQTSDLQQIFHENGLRIPDDELADVALALLKVKVEGDVAYPSRRATLATYVNVLRDAKGSLSAKEVARRVNEVDENSRARASKAVLFFRRSNEVFSADHGLWVHQDNLPFPRAVLDDVARRCLPDIQAAGGNAVSVRPMLARLIAEGVAPAEMTAHMLREALRQTGLVRAWRAGTDVAWLGGRIERLSILEWAALVAAELDPPFTINELVDEVVRVSGNLASSVGVQVKWGMDDLIPLGGGRYISRSGTFQSAEAFRESLTAVRMTLQGDFVWSAESEELRVPEVDWLVERFGTCAIWGLASQDPSFNTRVAGLLIWRATLGSTVWDVIGERFFSNNLVFTRPQLRRFLAGSANVKSAHVAERLVVEGVESGLIRRIGLGWYIGALDETERLLHALSKEPEVLRLALSSQDFVRESPARELLNDLREMHGQFRIPPA